MEIRKGNPKWQEFYTDIAMKDIKVPLQAGKSAERLAEIDSKLGAIRAQASVDLTFPAGISTGLPTFSVMTPD